MFPPPLGQLTILWLTYLFFNKIVNGPKVAEGQYSCKRLTLGPATHKINVTKRVGVAVPKVRLLSATSTIRSYVSASVRKETRMQSFPSHGRTQVGAEVDHTNWPFTTGEPSRSGSWLTYGLKPYPGIDPRSGSQAVVTLVFTRHPVTRKNARLNSNWRKEAN